MTIVVNIATDHHLLTAVVRHLHMLNENVDPDHKNAKQSIEQDFYIFAVCQTCHISASLQPYLCHKMAHYSNLEFKMLKIKLTLIKNY